MTKKELDSLLEQWRTLSTEINKHPKYFLFEKENEVWRISVDLDVMWEDVSAEEARNLMKEYFNGDVHKQNVENQYNEIKRKVFQEAINGNCRAFSIEVFQENKNRLVSEGYKVEVPWISWEETSTN